MAGWTTKRLGDVCDLQNGFAFKSKSYVDQSNTLNIRMSNIRPDGSFNPDHNIKYLPDSFATDYRQFLLKEGDLIIAMTDMAGDPKILGLPTLVENLNGRNFLLNQRVGKLNGFSEDVYVPYLSYFLSSPKIKNYYKSKGAGGLQINISKKDILTAEIPLPPLPEQKRIVAILGEAFAGIDAAVANTENNLANARELFESTLNAVFTQKGDGWVEKKLGEFSTFVSTGPFGAMLHKSDYVSEGVPLVNPINIVGNSIVPDESKLIDEEIKARLQRYILKEGDIVIGRRGEIGRCAVIDAEHDGWVCGTGCFFMRPISGVNPHFLANLIRSSSYREKLERVATGATMKNLSNKALANLTVALPDAEVQSKILSRLEVLATKTERLESIYQQKLDALAELKQSILQKAFAGELTALPDKQIEEAVA